MSMTCVLNEFITWMVYLGWTFFYKLLYILDQTIFHNHLKDLGFTIVWNFKLQKNLNFSNKILHFNILFHTNIVERA